MSPHDQANEAVLVKNRTRHTRWLGLALLPLIVFVQPLWMPEWLNKTLDVIGVLCLVACCFGRIWCSVYVGGRKNRELVDIGPYSVVRNPLYVFSFIGVIGIALLSKMATVLILAPLIFALYYRVVVARELLAKHGEGYRAYLRNVPRWLPQWSLWKDAQTVATNPKVVASHLLDCSAFFLALVLFEGLDIVNGLERLPILLRLP